MAGGMFHVLHATTQHRIKSFSPLPEHTYGLVCCNEVCGDGSQTSPSCGGMTIAACVMHGGCVRMDRRPLSPMQGEDDGRLYDARGLCEGGAQTFSLAAHQAC